MLCKDGEGKIWKEDEGEKEVSFSKERGLSFQALHPSCWYVHQNLLALGVGKNRSEKRLVRRNESWGPKHMDLHRHAVTTGTKFGSNHYWMDFFSLGCY